MFEGLLETLQQFEVITLYRHTSPDCDALGSQWGLASWLKHRFPSKQIYVLGAEGETVKSYELQGCMIRRASLSELNAENSGIMSLTLEMTYQTLEEDGYQKSGMDPDDWDW